MVSIHTHLLAAPPVGGSVLDVIRSTQCRLYQVEEVAGVTQPARCPRAH